VAELDENTGGRGGGVTKLEFFYEYIYTNTLINVRDKIDTQFYLISLFEIKKKQINYKY
jgi:hypothetical protein